jgi:long-chain acyl-CoA synthetase
MLSRLLLMNAEVYPDRTAIVQGDLRLTHAELERTTGRFAGLLQQLGVSPGDAVAVVLPNCCEFVIAFFAIVRLRAIMLPLNPGYTREELRQSLTERHTSVLITDARREPMCRDCAGAATVVVVEHNAWADCQEVPAPEDPFPGDALYLSTSGSTDFYKRICCTQENLFFEAHNFVETIGLSADHPILCTIPLFHSYGLGNCLLDAAYSGAPLVLEKNSEAPFVARRHRVLELLRGEKIGFYPGVPYQFEILAASVEDLGSIFQGVKWCISSGDALPRRTYDRFLARTGHPIRSLYGSTEAGSIAIDTGPKEHVEYFSLGPALRNVVIEIRDVSGHELPAGMDGEIWVKSPTIPPGGYENRPDLTRMVFRGGFYNTGDMGHKDDRGHLVLAGRKQSFINIAGYKVDTAEVEEVLASCPGVLEAAVLGVEAPRMGMLVKAAVVTDGSGTEAEIRAFCRQRLAFYKVPRLIEIHAALPRSAVGKILKSELGGVDAYLKGIRDVQTARTVAQLPASSPSRRRSLVASLVHEQSAAVLGRAPAVVSRTAGFIELGMDSFAAIELRARLEYLFDVELAETFTFDYPTVDAVTENLMNLLPALRSEARQIERK